MQDTPELPTVWYMYESSSSIPSHLVSFSRYVAPSLLELVLGLTLTCRWTQSGQGDRFVIVDDGMQ